MKTDFQKFATGHLGMNSLALEQYMDITSSYINPTIIEERQLNVAQMDVFSRLMMDRIIFLGTEVDDYSANVIQAQLLYLDSSDPGKDIHLARRGLNRKIVKQIAVRRFPVGIETGTAGPRHMIHVAAVSQFRPDHQFRRIRTRRAL